MKNYYKLSLEIPFYSKIHLNFSFFYSKFRKGLGKQRKSLELFFTQKFRKRFTWFFRLLLDLVENTHSLGKWEENHFNFHLLKSSERDLLYFPFYLNIHKSLGKKITWLFLYSKISKDLEEKHPITWFPLLLKYSQRTWKEIEFHFLLFKNSTNVLERERKSLQFPLL